MKITQNTRLLARLHPELDKKGLNIYNPYFEQANVDAVYLLFQSKNLSNLLQGLANLNIPGAIPAGFEKSPELLNSMDALDPLAAKVGKIGMIKQDNGKLIGHYQPGYGLLHAIEEITPLKDKSICIFGASHIAHGLIERLIIENKIPRQIALFNRTVKNAEKLAEQYPTMITRVGSIKEMDSMSADIFINTTYIGSKSNKGEDFLFSEKFLSAFSYIADVAFVPLHSQLITSAKKLQKPNSPGWKVFVHQASYILQTIFEINVDTDLLSKLAYKDFSENWK